MNLFRRGEKIGRGLGLISGGRQFHDRDIERMAELAHDLDATSYAGGWVQMINWPFLNVAPVAVNTFTTTQTIMSPSPQPYIPANSMNVGTRFRVRAWGSIASVAGTATTTIGLSITGPSVICASANQTPATGPLPWWFEGEVTVLVAGAASTASIIGQGIAFGLGATPATCVLVPATAPTAVTTTWATTVANAITVNGVWSVSNAGNSYTTYGASVEQLN